MSRETAIDLIAFGIVLLGLSLVLGQLNPDKSRLPCVIGVAGSASVWFLALLSLRGTHCRSLVIATLVVLCIALIALFPIHWTAFSEHAGRFRLAIVANTLLILFSIGEITVVISDKGRKV